MHRWRATLAALDLQPLQAKARIAARRIGLTVPLPPSRHHLSILRSNIFDRLNVRLRVGEGPDVQGSAGPRSNSAVSGQHKQHPTPRIQKLLARNYDHDCDDELVLLLSVRILQSLAHLNNVWIAVCLEREIGSSAGENLIDHMIIIL